MPVVRYFLLIGGALLTLLFVTDIYAPQPSLSLTTVDAERPIIRISSDRKWPDRIVFDTNLPTIVVPALAANVDTAEPTATAAPVSDISAKMRVRESFAQFSPAEPAKSELKVQKKRKIARIRAVRPTVLASQQPRYGFFGNSTW